MRHSKGSELINAIATTSTVGQGHNEKQLRGASMHLNVAAIVGLRMSAC
jgi:hypothetical protein